MEGPLLMGPTPYSFVFDPIYYIYLIFSSVMASLNNVHVLLCRPLQCGPSRGPKVFDQRASGAHEEWPGAGPGKELLAETGPGPEGQLLEGPDEELLAGPWDSY